MMNNIHHMNIYSSCKLCLYFYIKTSKTLSCMDILPIVPCMIQNKNIEQPDSILSNPAVFIALTHLFYLASVLIFNDLDHGAIRYFILCSGICLDRCLVSLSKIICRVRFKSLNNNRFSCIFFYIST